MTTELLSNIPSQQDELGAGAAKMIRTESPNKASLARLTSQRRASLLQDVDVLPKPDPPVVGKVTHCSIELYWGEALEEAEKKAARRLKFAERIKVTLQEQDRQGQWVNTYAGYARTFIAENLRAQENYRYRLRFTISQDTNSEWSAITQVKTTREPLNGEHLHRAVASNDLMSLEKILNTREVSVEVTDKYGFTPLMQASQRGYLEIAECLLDRAADIDHQNEAGKTALMLACFAGQIPLVKLLIQRGASLTKADRGGSTPMHWAVDSNNTDLVEWLLRNGADPNIADTTTGWTPLLRLATVTGNADMARILIRRKAIVDAVDKDGKTPLMTAAINNHVDLVQVLIDSGADLTIKNSYGKTALDMARAMERRGVAKIIDDEISARKVKQQQQPKQQQPPTIVINKK